MPPQRPALPWTRPRTDGLIHVAVVCFPLLQTVPRDPGRTTNPTDFTSLMDDLEAKAFGRLPDQTWFYPGLGRDSTLGVERPPLPEWRAAAGSRDII